MMEQNQRRFERIPQPFEVHWRMMGELSDAWRPTVTLDLSAGGMSFQSNESFDVETMLELQIQLPHMRSPLILHGRVARVKPHPSEGVEIGVEFFNVRSDQQMEIDELVRFLKKDR